MPVYSVLYIGYEIGTFEGFVARVLKARLLVSLRVSHFFSLYSHLRDGTLGDWQDAHCPHTANTTRTCQNGRSGLI